MLNISVAFDAGSHMMREPAAVTIQISDRTHPAMTRGQLQYLDAYKKSALAPKKKDEFQYRPYHEEYHLTAEETVALAQEFLPELKRYAIPEATAYAGASRVIAERFFETGAIVVWDEKVIDRDHPARIAIGDGPFEVVIENDYLISFIEKVPDSARKGGRHILVQSTTGGNTVIALAGYFTEVKKT